MGFRDDAEEFGRRSAGSMPVRAEPIHVIPPMVDLAQLCREEGVLPSGLYRAVRGSASATKYELVGQGWLLATRSRQGHSFAFDTKGRLWEHPLLVKRRAFSFSDPITLGLPKGESIDVGGLMVDLRLSPSMLEFARDLALDYGSQVLAGNTERGRVYASPAREAAEIKAAWERNQR